MMVELTIHGRLILIDAKKVFSTTLASVTQEHPVLLVVIVTVLISMYCLSHGNAIVVNSDMFSHGTLVETTSLYMLGALMNLD